MERITEDEVEGERDENRYFLVKPHTLQELQESFESGSWDAKLPIKKKIWEASRHSRVTLIMAINGSRHFCGYAVVDLTGVDLDDMELLSEEELKRQVCHPHLPRPYLMARLQASKRSMEEVVLGVLSRCWASLQCPGRRQACDCGEEWTGIAR